MRCAVVNLSSNLVENVIVADAAVSAAPDGYVLVDSDIANIGDSWSGSEIVPVARGIGTPTANSGISAL